MMKFQILKLFLSQMILLIIQVQYGHKILSFTGKI